MAVGHYQFNDQLQHGRILRRVLNGAESFLDEGQDLLTAGAQMIDGDGSQDAHFTYFTTKFGFPDNATARNAWNEFQSVMSKITGNGSVTDTNAAIVQALAKFR
jgi:hypothetical protein